MNKNILITGVGGAAGVFLIQHLQNNGFKVIAVDSNPCSYGLLHGDVNFVVPNILSEDYLSVMKSICNTQNVSFILPLIDEELSLIKGLESDHLKVLCPTVDFIKTCLDKFILSQVLCSCNLPIPKTQSLLDEANMNTYSLIIKPKTGRGSRDVYVASNEVEFNRIRNSLTMNARNFIVQEKIEGDEFTVSVVVNPANELIAVVPKKIIEKRGITKMAITESNKEIHHVCSIITKELKPHNSFNVQLIMSQKDGKPYIFEINPRYSTTVTLTIKAGVDEIMVPIDFALNNQVSHSNTFQEGLVLLRSVKEEFIGIDDITTVLIKF